MACSSLKNTVFPPCSRQKFGSFSGAALPGLSEDEMNERNKLLDRCLKPEEITSADPSVKNRRVDELVSWFTRLADGNANPKWAVAHAFELAHYVDELRARD
jgi:hypothetical protein